MPRKTYLLLLFSIVTLITSVTHVNTHAQDGCGSDDGAIFFSEYVEGSSNNKALEIFNGYGQAVNLSNFKVRIYFNGNSNPNTTITLSGTLNPGEVFVLADDGADSAILAVADQTSTASLFNGNDAIELIQITSQQDGTTINVTHDVIGQIGYDPGSEWGSGNTSTKDNTLRRKSSVSSGDSNGSDTFDPSVEWDGYPKDTFGGLGSHTATCIPTAVTFGKLKANTGPSNAVIITLMLGLSILLFLGAWLRRKTN